MSNEARLLPPTAEADNAAGRTRSELNYWDLSLHGAVPQYKMQIIEKMDRKGTEGRLLVIDSRPFFRECIRRSIESALSIPVLALASVSELANRPIGPESIRLIMILLADGTNDETAYALSVLSEFALSVPTVILSQKYDVTMMRAVMAHGAKAYIPMTVEFEIAIEAVRFVLAGGTYVPPECLLAVAAGLSTQSNGDRGAITGREFAVVKAIQQGKSNKVIAYEQNMCESTVKVHVRRIMKKMKAKNRTDLAIRSSQLLSCSGCTNRNECWFAVRCLQKST
jgi:DNA-binding NarL/FixJ family response regulator